MKRIILCGVAIAASLGLVTTASAQYGSDYQGSSYQYSSYGQRIQEAERDADRFQDAVPTPSPSDQIVPSPTYVPKPTDNVNNDGSGNKTGYESGSYGATGCGPTGYGSERYGITGGGTTDGDCGTAGGCGIGGKIGNLIKSNDRNVVFGLRGLVFERDYEDDRGLGSNSLGQYLFTTDADHDFFGGFEATLGVRNCSGSGWEFNYWGLFPDQADVTFGNPQLYSAIPGLAAVDLNGFDVYAIFNTADDWRLYRNTEIHNLEFNLLRNAGTTCGFFGGTTNLEWMAGIRWLKFTEDIRLTSNNSNAGYPSNTYYDLEADNNLLGFQIGARAERCVSNKLSVALGTKFGIYNNDICAYQAIRDNNGTYATVPSGPVDYNFCGEKNDIATLGELDLALNYQFSCQWRANLGYRAIGITSVALAADQIPYNFNDTQNIQRANSNGNLLLHGAYFGVERSF